MKFKLIVTLSLVASFAAAFASQEVVGKPVTLPQKPQKETTAQVMARHRELERTGRLYEIKREETEHEMEREFLPQNPLSPRAPSWPGISTDSPNVRPLGKGTDVGALFSIGANFPGPVFPGNGPVPPDTCGDVSLSTVIVCSNDTIKSYSRAGVLGSLSTTCNNFFTSVRNGAGCSDPRVIFDRLTNRWFIAIINTTGTNNRIMLAISSGEAITAATTWTFHQFAQNVGGGPSGFADYETLGVDNNAIYIGSNRFNGSFANTDLFVVRKSALLSGSLVVTPFRNLIGATQGMFTPWPCSNDDPAATTGFIIGVDAFSFGKLVGRRVSTPGGTPTISADIAITVPTTANPSDVSIPINGAGGTLTIDALDDRLFFARIAKNRLTGQDFAMTAHSIRTNSAGVGGAGDRNSARWYQIGSVFSGTPTLVSGTTVDTASSGFQHLTIASTAMNGQGHQLIGFTRANATTSPGVGISYRDSGSSLVSAPVLAQAGVNYYNLQTGSNNKRWGDYSFTVVDPRNMMTMWTFQEYSSANNQWGTRAVEVKAPAPTVTTLAPNNANQGQTLNVVVTGTGIFDPDPSYPDHLAFNFGPNITVNTVTWTNATTATVNITVGASAATGARSITLINPDGQTANSTFTVNSGNISISGTITLPGWIGTGAGVGAPQFVFELRNASTNAVLATQTVALNAGNTFNWSVAQPGNTQYKLWIKGVKRFLGVVQTINTGAGGVSGLAYTLPNGDIDGSNIVSTPDYNALRAAWGATSSNANWATFQWADLDGNGFVGTADYNLMRATWGSVGNP